MRKKSAAALGAGIVLSAVAIRAAMPWFVERYVNRQLAQIGEYSGRVVDVDLALVRGAYTVHDLTIVKVGSAAEPFLELPLMDVSLEWRALLHGELVGELVMRNPVLNLIQGERDADTQLGTGVNWPEQVRRFFPFRFNRVEVQNGTATFRAPGIEADESLTLERLDVVLRDLTNVEERSTPAFASIRAHGAVMGDAPITLNGRMNPNASAPTFDVDLTIEGARVVEVNPWLREFVNVDAESGTFSMYTELAASNGRFEGYVKPILENPRIFRPGEPAEGPFQKAWEALVEIGTQILKNPKQDQVATELPLSGELEDPDADVLTAVVGLLRNAFVNAVAHSLEHDVGLRDVQVGSASEESDDATKK
ncbi:MAG TPA: DUF748 domain-containing protein [Gammaproteobacteria bacterium]